MGNGCSGCNCNKNEKQDEIQADVNSQNYYSFFVERSSVIAAGI